MYHFSAMFVYINNQSRIFLHNHLAFCACAHPHIHVLPVYIRHQPITYPHTYSLGISRMCTRTHPRVHVYILSQSCTLLHLTCSLAHPLVVQTFAILPNHKISHPPHPILIVSPKQYQCFYY